MKKKPWGNGLYKRPRNESVITGTNRAQRRRKPKKSYTQEEKCRRGNFLALFNRTANAIKSSNNRQRAFELIREWVAEKRKQINGVKE